MKLVLCGKGGCGKSTTTVLLAKELARNGKRVLVVDSDESNFGLHMQLGMPLPRDFIEAVGGREVITGKLMAAMESQQMPQFFDAPWTISDIPAGYYEEKDGVTLIAAGKIDEAGEGCACAMGNVVAALLANLQLTENDYVLVDMEAGVEHFGRGVDNFADGILMVADTSFESLRLSQKILDMGQSIRKPVWFVLNKVTDESKQIMQESIADPNKVAGILFADSALAAAGLKGDELTEARSDVEELAAFLMEQR